MENTSKVRFIHGALDRLVSVEELRQRLRPAAGQVAPEIAIIPNAGHMAHWEATEEVVRGVFG
jgi:pimeloyl-ACP methyl ester carboxylesterase